MRVICTGGGFDVEGEVIGGEDFDQRIIDFLVEDFAKTTSIDLSQDRMARQRLKEAAEKAKCDLSTMPQTTIDYMVSKIPMGRTCKVEEVASLVHYLASNEASFTTGQCYDISGGRATY